MSARLTIVALVALVACPLGAEEITRLWLTHKSPDPSRIVVNWESVAPGNSVVYYSTGEDDWRTVTIEENVTLHHVEIPLTVADSVCRYRVTSGDATSAEAAFKTYPSDVLRVAVVADWQGRPKLDSLVADRPHLLLTAGDNIDGLHRQCGASVRDCTRPYGELIDAYPELFRSTPFMPVLGNHDREIRPRGPKPPAEAVYDVEATAFRKFFELPDDEWKWHFEVPAFGLRLIALDLNHISDMGTTWQTCHPFDKDSAQYQWYEQLTRDPKPPLVVTLYNEKHSSVRSQAGGAWGQLLARGNVAITGFGHFAERAEVAGLTCYNTALSGRGDKYPDPKSAVLASENNYLLMTFSSQPPGMVVELKSLEGRVLDRKAIPVPQHAEIEAGAAAGAR